MGLRLRDQGACRRPTAGPRATPRRALVARGTTDRTVGSTVDPSRSRMAAIETATSVPSM
jgi:hypothetical protein